jgi:hypothetical protein
MNSQHIIRVITSHTASEQKVGGFQSLELWCFTHNNIMKYHLIDAQQIVFNLWEIHALVDIKGTVFPISGMRHPSANDTVCNAFFSSGSKTLTVTSRSEY